MEWVDSWSASGWKEPRELGRAGKTCFSVGWVIDDNPEIIQLAGSAGMTDFGGFDEVLGNITIPKVAVIRTKTLSRKRL